MYKNNRSGVGFFYHLKDTKGAVKKLSKCGHAMKNFSVIDAIENVINYYNAGNRMVALTEHGLFDGWIWCTLFGFACLIILGSSPVAFKWPIGEIVVLAKPANFAVNPSHTQGRLAWAGLLGNTKRPGSRIEGINSTWPFLPHNLYTLVHKSYGVVWRCLYELESLNTANRTIAIRNLTGVAASRWYARFVAMVAGHDRTHWPPHCIHRDSVRRRTRGLSL